VAINTVMARLLAPGRQERPILVEAFVDAADESAALKAIRNLNPPRQVKARRLAKEILGPQGIRTAKRLLGRRN
jgi:hypothetical protein